MSPLQVFNTLTNKKEEFVPITPGKVLIYSCGPTVYDYSHLGHARKEIVWDVFQRYLRFSGYDVTYVRNITDVDDKIIKRAKEAGARPDKIARQFTYEFWHDMNMLNVDSPDIEPRATEFIGRMQDFTLALIKAGHAYQAEGDVYFDVGSFKEYGKLGKKDLEQLISGSREQVKTQDSLAHLKKNPFDFALWKSAPKGEAGWESPWGWGRPGWHLECSTMIKSVMGETIDIHIGGEDLVFPHHENEIAQSEALHGKPLARYWLHNAFVQVSSEKMAKSLGNFATIRQLLESFTADTIRIFALQTHYRNPIDFTPEALQAAKIALQRLLRAVEPTAENGNAEHAEAKLAFDVNFDETTKSFDRDFREAMDNDFNTAVAMSLLFSLADKISVAKDEAVRQQYSSMLSAYAGVLGLTLTDDRRTLDSQTGGRIVDFVLQLRKEARDRKDFATSDLIRKQLGELGISVMDVKGGNASWERS